MDEIELPGEYPRPTASDIATTAVRALIAAVPYAGGSVDEVLGLVLPSPIQKRRDKWFKSVASSLELLAQRGEAPKLESLLEDERFVTATMQATRVAVGSHREEKHRFLRNVLMKVAAGKGTSEEMWGSFFRCIEDFGAPHMMLLNLLANDERRARSGHCHTYGQYVSEGLGKPSRQRYSYLFPLALTDLSTRGLVTISNMQDKFTVADVITYYGREFLRFVASYEPSAGK